jgi:hypothetical protein
MTEPIDRDRELAAEYMMTASWHLLDIITDAIAAAREEGRREEQQREEIVRLRQRDASLFDAIAHGSPEHRAWLKKAIEDHFAGRPVEAERVPSPQTGGDFAS